MKSAFITLTVLAGLALLSACGDGRERTTESAAKPGAAIGTDPVLLAAGDIASCSSTGDDATAALLDALEGDVAALGDLAYESGSPAEFANCYEPNWGGAKSRTHPSPGNHEYNTPGASGYFSYFGAAAGDPTKGYYSYDLGAWHMVSLNSNCAPIGGCNAGSPQELWLRQDLAAHAVECTLAYWHHARFSSANHGSQAFMQPIWQALYDYGADVVLSGHDHDYERFAPQTPAGAADPASGIREFVVGTGGRSHYTVGTPIANSETSNDDTFGVLQLTLHPAGYDWQFMPEAGKTFADTGSGACHGPTQPDVDADGWIDAADNCPAVANSDQRNSDANFVDTSPPKLFDDITWPNSDELGDACDADGDNDGLLDTTETPGLPCASASAATDPLVRDTDGDHALDGAECALGFDPASAGSTPPLMPAGDTDHDGLPDAFEGTIGTNPALPDSDGDKINDGVEVMGYNSNPLSTNTDGDACGDGKEIGSVNDDTKVNSTDQLIVAQAFTPLHPYYVFYDINKDGKVNSTDQLIQAKVYGSFCP